jgi:hypothetical protein
MYVQIVENLFDELSLLIIKKMIVLILMHQRQTTRRIKSRNPLVGYVISSYYFFIILDAVRVTVTCPFCYKTHDKADSRRHRVNISIFSCIYSKSQFCYFLTCRKTAIQIPKTLQEHNNNQHMEILIEV